MSTQPVSCHPSTSIGSVADMMLHHKIHCLPVVSDDGTLVGILTSSDLIRLLRSKSWMSEDRIPFEWEKPQSLVASAN